MQVGETVKINDRRCILYSSRGTVQSIQAPDYPWRGELVLVKTEDGRRCLVEPKALVAA